MECKFENSDRYILTTLVAQKKRFFLQSSGFKISIEGIIFILKCGRWKRDHDKVITMMAEGQHSRRTWDLGDLMNCGNLNLK